MKWTLPLEELKLPLGHWKPFLICIIVIQKKTKWPMGNPYDPAISKNSIAKTLFPNILVLALMALYNRYKFQIPKPNPCAWLLSEE